MFSFDGRKRQTAFVLLKVLPNGNRETLREKRGSRGLLRPASATHTRGFSAELFTGSDQ
jgi:hypothetical protein